MVKKSILYTLMVIVFGLLGISSTSSCKAKEGCGLEEKYAPKVDKDGRLSTKRGNSSLFSKKQKKKLKIRD